MTATADIFDVAVIGGGIQGVGVARAANRAGFRTLLLERSEWAAATSRGSSKLIHGGLRYLESGQFNLVYHSLRERQRLFRERPTLVKPVKFFIPIYRHTRRRPWQIRAGLSLYALLTGLQPQARFRSIPRREWHGLTGLDTNGLEAVFQYWDGQTDDAALTRAIAADAEREGVQCRQHSELIAAKLLADGRYRLDIRSLDIRSPGMLSLDVQADTDTWQCHARQIVNASGPWVNELLQRCTPVPPLRSLSWVKGSHIVLPAMQLPGIFYLEAPRDGRAVFVMPWQGKTLIGTTEVEVDTPHAVPTQAEIDYLLETARHYFPQLTADIIDSFAGVRVLPASDDRPFSRARESVITRFTPINVNATVNDAAAIISIYGGKLTTFQHTADQVVKLLQTDN